MEQCPNCFRVKQHVVVLEQLRATTREICLRCFHDKWPYLTMWRLTLTEAEKKAWCPPPEMKTYWDKVQLYNNSPDNFGFIPVAVKQMDRMFYEEHQRVPVEGGYEFRRLEHTNSVSVPNHLNAEVIAERFNIKLTKAKRLTTAFKRLEFDWKVVWQHCKQHLAECKGDEGLEDLAISYYEDLADRLPELEPLNTDDKILGIDGLNLFYSVY